MLQACLLALIAGYADTVGYLRYDAFAGLMTGNTILLGIEVATNQLGMAFFHASIIVVFLLGVIVSRVFLRLGLQPWIPLTMAAALLVVSSFAEKLSAALLLALAMGTQNSAANRFNGVALNTVFITGNLQRLGEGMIAWAWPHPDHTASKSDGVAIFAYVWIAYAVGAAWGAVGNARLEYPLFIPAVLLPFAIVRLRTERFAPPSLAPDAPDANRREPDQCQG
jgi:uncharacterized membrane protein YoaK (UPF0700 family)